MSQYYNSYPGAYSQNNVQQGPTPGLKALKNSFGSTFYLIAAIAFTLTIVLSLVQSFVPSASIIGTVITYLQQYAAMLGMPLDDINVASLFSGTNIAGTIIGMIPSILIALGMWLIYASAKKAEIPASTAGIIALVGLNSLGSYYGSSGSGTMAVAAVVLLVAIIVMVLVIIYYAKLAGIYGISKDVLRYNRSSKKVSMFVIVINFIGLFFTAIGTISSLVSASSMFGLSGTYVLVTVLSAVATFLASLFQTLTFVRARQEFATLGSSKGAAGYQSYNFETGSYNTGSFNTGGFQNPYQTPQAPAQQGQFQQYQQNAYPQQGQYQQRAYQAQNAAPQANQYQQYQQAAPQYQQRPQYQPFTPQNAAPQQPQAPQFQVPPVVPPVQAAQTAADHAQEIADQAASNLTDQQ